MGLKVFTHKLILITIIRIQNDLFHCNFNNVLFFTHRLFTVGSKIYHEHAKF